MRTRFLHSALALSLTSVTSVVLQNCGGSSSPTSPGETSFLTGMWNKTLTISRIGQPDITGPATWTIELVPRPVVRISIPPFVLRTYGSGHDTSLSF